MPLESIAACVIAGVSLRGGLGRVENVVLGALFIVLVQNGMNLARIESYLQTVVLGLLLILAVIADRLRLRYIANLKD
jgi:ribose transport system permease protein